MSSSAERFYHSVADFLSTYEGVEYFLRGDKAIGKVLACQKKMPVAERVPQERNLQGRWSVCHSLTSGCLKMVALIFSELAYFFSFCGCESLAIYLRGKSLSLEGKNSDLSVPSTFKLVGKTINRPNEKASIYNQLDPIPVVDPKLKKRLFSPKSHLKFGHVGGICRGEVDWFLKLYLKTRAQCSDSQQHMKALARRFKKGGPAEATLLQSIYVRNGKILGLKNGMRSAFSKCYFPDVLRFCANDLHSTQKVINQYQLESLPPGAYKIGLPFHATAWIKISDELGYFFDPNEGVTEIKGGNQSAALFNKLKAVFQDLPIASDSETQISRDIYFVPYALR